MNPFISTRMHAIADYIAGVLVVASPYLFGFARLGGAALFIPVVFGSLQLVMVIFTNHELGLIKVIPLQLHLVIDMLMGFTLLVSPFLYKFYHFVFLPHVLLGLFLMGSAIFTRFSPLTERLKLFDERGF